jgi:hypothetical protein
MVITFVSSHSANERLRIVASCCRRRGSDCVALAALLSIGQIADLFKERATLDQDYDLGHLGRFGRYILAPISHLKIHWAWAHAIQQILPGRPAQHVSQFVHVRRLARRLRLCDADARDHAFGPALFFL